MASSTPMMGLGWFLGMLSWGAVIGMLVAPNWEHSGIIGDSRTTMDNQGQSRGLWWVCTGIPSGQTVCDELDSSITESQAHVIATRSILIMSVIVGFVAGIVLLVSFKCIEIGPTEVEDQQKLSRISGYMFLACGLGVTAVASWYIVAVYQSANTFQSIISRRKVSPWSIGESVQITMAAGILWTISAFLVICFTNSRAQKQDYFQPKTVNRQEYV